MKIRLVYIIVILIGVLTSCDDFLDVKPKGKLIPNSVKDFDNLLNSNGIVEWNFLDNNRGSLIPYLTDDIKLSEELEEMYSTHPNLDRYNAFIFEKPYKKQTIPDRIWTDAYKSMAYFNIIINEIDKVKANEDEQRLAREVKAQARIGRAWLYFNLSNVYGPVYDPKGANETKVIPLVVSPDLEAPIPNLSSVKEIYEFVLKDLHKALPNLPESVAHPSRASKRAGCAMLAQVHLFKQQWDSVSYYADKAWELDDNIYDYNKLSFENPDDEINSEIIGLSETTDQKENLFYRYTATNIGVSQSYISDELLGLFDEKDLRFHFFIKKMTGKGEDMEYQHRYNHVRYKRTAGFSYPEVLLLRAEGFARMNKLQEAIDILNILKEHRYTTDTKKWELGNLSQDDVITLVLKERRKELAFITNKRFLDLKRFSLEPNKPWSKQKVVHWIGTKKYEGEIANRFYLVLPDMIKDYNPSWEY